MTPAAFKRLCADIRMKWTAQAGLVVLLRGPAAASTELRLCVGPVTNTGIIAEDCVVWLDDSRVYSGGIETDELKKLLTRHRICRAVYTTFRMLCVTDWTCLGNARKCDGVRCPVRARLLRKMETEDAERLSVQDAEGGVRKR